MIASLLNTVSSQTQNLFSRAIVSSNDDPDKLGRVKLEFPQFNDDHGKKPSQWARVLFPYASDGHGFWILPEVGDEVMVLFENGGIDSPIVMGSLYGPSQKPPASEKGTTILKDKAGNTIEMKSEEGIIEIKDKSGGKVILNNGKITIEGNQIEIGQSAAHALIKGDLFQQLFNSHTHTVGPATSTPPNTPMDPNMLSKKVKIE